jgi:sarcosine oxidase subunit beta
MPRIADAVVIGGGIQGCSTALQLARRGLRVVVLEKDHVARHASGVNAGGVRRLRRHEAEIPLSNAAMEMWYGIETLLEGRYTGFHVTGQVAVAETEVDWQWAQQRAARLRVLGYSHEILLSAAELYELLPGLAPGMVGGLAAHEDGAASPYHTTMAFRDAALQAGAVIDERIAARALMRRGSVWQVETDAGNIQAGSVVNCAGAWAGALAAQCGEHVPLQPIAPMMMVTSRLPAFLKPVVLGIGRPLSFKQMPNGTMLIGGGHLGTADLKTNATTLDVAKLARSARTTSEFFPRMRGTTLMRAWSGVESRLPDDIPVIGPSSTEPGLFHAFGFSAHGFQLGPIVGEIMAQLVTQGTTQYPIAPFAITRFH